MAQFIFDRPQRWHWLLPVGMNNSIVSMGAGTPAAVAEIATAEVGGFTVAASSDSVSFLWEIPIDMDLSKELNFRAMWSQNAAAAAAGTGDVVFLYGAKTTGTDAVAIAATAFSTDGGSSANVAADVPMWSNWSTINGSVITDESEDDFLIVMMAATLATITDMTLYAAQSKYYRKFYAGV
jgi:hypothetical protein